MKIRVVLCCALLLLGLTAGTRPSSGPGSVIGVDQRSLDVAAGSQGLVAVTLASAKTSTVPVSLTVKSAPKGIVVTVPAGPVGPDEPAIVKIAPSSTTPPGLHKVVISGTQAGRSSQTTIAVSVTATRSFSMSLSPDTRIVASGSPAVYTLQIKRGRVTGPINLVLSGLPAHATGTVTPSTTLGSKATVHLDTTNVAAGTYVVTVIGSAGSTSATATAQAYLVVAPPPAPNFQISGALDRTLFLGTIGRIDLAVTNPLGRVLKVQNLTVAVTGTSNAACAASNFAVTQYPGPYPLKIPAHTTKKLSQFGVATSALPSVKLLDLPVNQDACKNVSLTLKYTGGAGN
jgi:hypothetical protein